MKFSSPETSLRRNSFWLLFARVSVQGLAVLFIAIVARRLAVESFGQFSFIASVVLIGNTFTSFGTDTLLIREIAKAKQITGIVTRALTLQLFLSAMWCFSIWIFRADRALLIYSLSLFPLAFFSITSSLLRAFERMDLFWTLSLVGSLVQIIGALFAVDLLSLCTLLLFGNVITALVALWICSASLSGFSLFPLLDFRPILRLVLPFAVLMSLSILSQRLGVLSVSIFINDKATGLFASAARIVDGLKFGHYAVLGALLPALSRNLENSRGSYHFAFWRILGFTVLVAIMSIFLAEPILLFLFGREYVSAANLTQILVWGLVPYTLSAFISVHLVVHNKEIILLKAIVISLMIWVVAFVLMIRFYGLAGAAWASLIGEIAQAVIFLRLSPQSFKHFADADSMERKEF